ncbi:glycine--tRNA ligase subunit beta [Roseitranquillus sediminis]|uniref:glycine--tRNA ligase subunit beta n=1 Tax=Roseitranquillus sediminis TaxID=2809051 RepID=UPI001D0C16E0|nr:glycine--tRNA ligase subunit beta [Roseitranquillus sediminis]MBM9594674.1 glycine--tRNA ligase subunit beta [Roseitranquillus sediminis]
MPDLLIELFSEEIPARMQARAADDLRRLMTDGLVEAGLTYRHATAHHTPRRLALAVEGLTPESPTLREERKGPREDAPGKAVEGFARSVGLTPDQLEVRDTGKGRAYFAVYNRPGRPAAEIVAEVLEATVRNFPWPKSMRWGQGSLRWVRPLHRILCILTDEVGAQVVPVEIDGIRAADVTEGHRFMAPGEITVTSFDDYAAKLKRAKVVLSAEERAEIIRHDAEQAVFAQGLELVEDRALMAEVAGLVEWPVVLLGEIGERFLDLPPEVLQTSMREHQKFFSVRKSCKNLQEGVESHASSSKNAPITHFVTVANRETADHGATILAGNRKVLDARLSDALFFWENDLAVAREGMEEWRNALKNVTFHAKLGSQADRIDRIAALAREIAPAVGADPDQAEQAARVAKLDLASEMVYEFPELQGVMGRYYAEAAGLPPEIAAAAPAHYAPLVGPSDAVSSAPVSVAVALADRLDTLTGFWAIDEKPTGSKDPFALRRAGLGLIRLVTLNQLRLSVCAAFDASTSAFGEQYRRELDRTYRQEAYDVFTGFRNLQETLEHFKETDSHFGLISDSLLDEDLEDLKSVERLFEDLVDRAVFRLVNERVSKLRKLAPDVLSFLHDRLKVHLRDQGIRHDVIDACLAMPGNDDLTLLVRRAEALAAVLKTDDGENLVQGFRRANNILTQAEAQDGVSYEFGADRKFAETDEERRLFDALDAAEAEIAPAMQAEDFATAMAAMARLRAPIDDFFEAVQVNTDNQIVRRNRLNMLNRIRATCLSVADLTRLEG